MRELSIVDRAYMAGIVDGEGSISITRFRKNYHYNWGYALFCTVTNSDLELLKWLKDSTRVGKISSKNRSKAHWKQCYQWVLRVDEISPFLQQVLPYLRVRRRQAEIVLQFIANTRYTGPHHPLTEEEMTLKENLFYEIEALNERAKP